MDRSFNELDIVTLRDDRERYVLNDVRVKSGDPFMSGDPRSPSRIIICVYKIIEMRRSLYWHTTGFFECLIEPIKTDQSKTVWIYDRCLQHIDPVEELLIRTAE